MKKIILYALWVLFIAGCGTPPYIADDNTCISDDDCVIYKIEEQNPCCSGCGWQSINKENAEAKEKWKNLYCNLNQMEDCDWICKEPSKDSFIPICREGICDLEYIGP